MKVQAEERSEIAEDLSAVLGRLYGFLRRAILPSEMSLTQASALGTLRDLGPQRITDLADREGVRQPTCTGLINNLEAQGWVVRTSDETDRRTVRVDLTSQGRRVLESIIDARASVLDRYLRELTREEQHVLAAALPVMHRLIEVGSQAEDGRPQPA